MICLPIGTRVKICDATTSGTITAITIRDESVSYEVSYWLNGEYKSVWLPMCEIAVTTLAEASREPLKIGF